jgi:WD40 repeat protein
LRFSAGELVIEHEVEFVAGQRARLAVDLPGGTATVMPPTVEDLAPAGQLDVGERAIKSVCVTPDGRLVAAIEYGQSAIHLWDLELRAPFDVLFGDQRVRGVAFDATGAFLLAMHGSDTVTVFDLRRGRRVSSLGRTDRITPSMLPVTNGRRLWAHGCTDRAPLVTTITSWDLHSPAEPHVLSVDGRLSSLAVDPQGRTLAGAVDAAPSVIMVLSAADGSQIKRLARHRENIESVAFSPDGAHLASLDTRGGLKIWDTAGWRVVHSLANERHVGPTSVAWSPDSRFVAVRNYHRISIWAIDDGVLARDLEIQEQIECFAFAPDGTTLVVGCYSGSVQVWKTN